MMMQAMHAAPTRLQHLGVHLMTHACITRAHASPRKACIVKFRGRASGQVLSTHMYSVPSIESIMIMIKPHPIHKKHAPTHLLHIFGHIAVMSKSRPSIEPIGQAHACTVTHPYHALLWLVPCSLTEHTRHSRARQYAGTQYAHTQAHATHVHRTVTNAATHVCCIPTCCTYVESLQTCSHTSQYRTGTCHTRTSPA